MHSNNPTVETAVAPRPVQTSNEYLSFRVDNEAYGIGILNVQEIRRCDSPTRIFNARPFVSSVVSQLDHADCRIAHQGGLNDVVYHGLALTTKRRQRPHADFAGHPKTLTQFGHVLAVSLSTLIPHLPRKPL